MIAKVDNNYRSILPYGEELEVETYVQHHGTVPAGIEIVFANVRKSEVTSYIRVEHVILNTTPCSQAGIEAFE